MTFTYDPTNPSDITRVRYHLGDVVEEAAIFSDAEITFVISETGGWQRAVVSMIGSIIARMSAEPDFRADWLEVNASRSVAAWRVLLAEKRREFGLVAVSGRGRAVYRSDSKMTGPGEGW